MLSPVMSSRSLESRGIAALILGLVVLILRGPMLVGLTLLFGGYLIANGIFALVSALKKGVEGRGWLFVEAAICIFAGFAIFARPLVTAFGLTYLIGVWAILSGVLQIGEAFILRRYIRREALYLLGGVLTLLLGFAILSGLFTRPFIIRPLIGIYGVLFGIFSLVAASEVHTLEESTVERKERPAA